MEEIAIVRAELLRQHRDSRGTIKRGVILIALVVPILMGTVMVGLTVGGIAGGLAIVGGVLYTLLGSIGGMVTIASGLVEHRRTRKELYDYDHVRQLPAARLVLRGPS